MDERRGLPWPIGVAILVIVYFFAAKFGLSMAFAAPQVSAVWPPSGIALASLLIFGYRFWTAVTVGSLLVNLASDAPLPAAAAIAMGNTLEAVVAVWLLERRGGWSRNLGRLRDALRLIVLGAGLSTMISASIGVASLTLAQVERADQSRLIRWSDFGPLWREWWLGDAMGILVVAPVILTWVAEQREWTRHRRAEALALLVLLIAVGSIVFTGKLGAGLQEASLAYVVFPFVIWAALRLGQRATTTVTLVAATLAIWSVLNGLGPFGGGPVHSSLLMIQVFMGSVAVTALILGATITEGRMAESQARQSEQRLRLALEAGGMATWEWDIHGDRVVWSPGAEAVRGAAPHAEGETFQGAMEYIHPDDRRRVEEGLAAVLRHGTDHHLEYRVIWPDGSVHWVDARGTVFRDRRGRAERLMGMCIGMDVRKRLEEVLHQRIKESSEAGERMRSVVDTVIDGIITIDESGIIQSINPAAERIFGYSAGEVLGQNVKIFMPEPYYSEHDEYLAQYLRTRAPKIIGIGREVMGRRKDGTTFPMDLAVGEFHLGGRTYFTGVVRDISERMRVEKNLRLLADASAALADVSDIHSTLQRVAGLAVPGFADWCTVDLLAHDGSLERLAVAHADPHKVALAEEIHRRYPPDPEEEVGVYRVVRTGRAQIVAEVTDAMLAGVGRDDEHRRILLELGICSYMCVPLAVHGQVLGGLTFVSAESGRRYNLNDLTFGEELARRAATSLENARLYAELRAADRRKDEFLAMLAHELRNPLAPIRSGLDIIAMDPGSHLQTVTLMQQQLEHLVRLVDDLLDVSRIVRGRVELRPESVTVAEIIHRSVAAVAPTLRAQNQKIEVSVPAEPLWVNADPVRMVQVVENLLNNASKYSEAGAPIVLEAERQGNCVALRVRDRGIGIEAGLLPHVFELFTQGVHSLDRSQGGLGIGLTLVRSLVEMHGGTVDANSLGPGKGSEFTVRLPLIDGPQNGACFKHAEGSSNSAPSRRILVVDDNASAAKMLATLLQRLGPHTVATESDGRAALKTALAFQPHIVLLDIGLPGMNGYEVARRLRSELEFDGILVALTGYGQDEDRRRSREAGFDQHIVKPPSMELLVEILHRSGQLD